MRGSRARMSEREYIERQKALAAQEAEAFQRNLEHTASEIAARSVTPREAAHACQMAAQFHALDGTNLWRLIEMVMVAFSEKAAGK